MRYRGKLVIDLSERPSLALEGERSPIFHAAVRCWHRNDQPFGEGRTKARAIAALAADLGRPVDDLLADAHINDQTGTA